MLRASHRLTGWLQVGGIIGFSLAFGGANAVVWYEPIPTFPYVAGLVPIVISWFLSPVAAGIVAFVIFLAVRTVVLRRANSTNIAFYVLPVLIIITIWVNLFFILVRAGLNGTAMQALSHALECTAGSPSVQCTPSNCRNHF